MYHGGIPRIRGPEAFRDPGGNFSAALRRCFDRNHQIEDHVDPALAFRDPEIMDREGRVDIRGDFTDKVH